MFVVYGIPDRDCTGGESAGGLTTETYLPWVEADRHGRRMATRPSPSLEPDALPGAVQCGVVDAARATC